MLGRYRGFASSTTRVRESYKHLRECQVASVAAPRMLPQAPIAGSIMGLFAIGRAAIVGIGQSRAKVSLAPTNFENATGGSSSYEYEHEHEVKLRNHIYSAGIERLLRNLVMMRICRDPSRASHLFWRARPPTLGIAPANSLTSLTSTRHQGIGLLDICLSSACYAAANSIYGSDSIKTQIPQKVRGPSTLLHGLESSYSPILASLHPYA